MTGAVARGWVLFTASVRQPRLHCLGVPLLRWGSTVRTCISAGGRGWQKQLQVKESEDVESPCSIPGAPRNPRALGRTLKNGHFSR